MSEEQGLTPYETREILFYKTENGEVRVEILLFQENLWLTQAKMAELFEVQKAAISKHLKNIFESGELNEDSVVSKMETTAADGKRYQTNYYNLDAIIAVGYRVNSKKATMFRIWANRVLKEFIIKGYVKTSSARTISSALLWMEFMERTHAIWSAVFRVSVTPSCCIMAFSMISSRSRQAMSISSKWGNNFSVTMRSVYRMGRCSFK